MNVTILLPAYNEALEIANTIQNLKDLYPDFEILVVDDGSTDKTREIAMSAGANVRSHPYNIGNGAVLKTGLRCAKGKYVIMMDSDGQHTPEDIGDLLAHKEQYDMIVGARTKKSDTSLHRDIANLIYNNLASYVCKFPIKDLTSDFRLINRKTALGFINFLPNTFSYPTTITMAYLRSVCFVCVCQVYFFSWCYPK